ncbi:MAG: hypothetical protein NTW21_01925 [Verrucomicrobia bacterium]|nr:hypothetical protein [Verrucomicrobiota bacterium]
MGVIVTHGVAMGWYVAGPLALKNAKSFSGIHRQFLDNSMPRSGSMNITVPDLDGKCFGTFSRFMGWVCRANGPEECQIIFRNSSPIPR